MSKNYQKIDMAIRVYFNVSLIPNKIYHNFVYFFLLLNHYHYVK